MKTSSIDISEYYTYSNEINLEFEKIPLFNFNASICTFEFFSKFKKIIEF